MKIYHSIILFSVVLFLFSCGHNRSEDDGHNHGTETHSEDDEHNHGAETHSEDGEHEEGSIHLTKEQIKAMDIQFGNFSAVNINDFINATGTLGLPPNALTSVSSKANGFIKNSNKYVEGSYVKKGVVMAYLENLEFILLTMQG